MSDSGPVFLFAVEDRFSIEGRGMILFPGIPWECTTTVKLGDPLVLRTPLGEIIETSVGEFPSIRRCGADGKLKRTTPVSLPAGFHMFDIPIGTEVFLGPPGGNP